MPTLIVCEGDSAKSFVISGFGVLDRKLFGVLPMKGNVLNVLNTSESKMSENKEFNAFMDVFNLNPNMQYASQEELSTLRYGRVLVLPDQVGKNFLQCLFNQFYDLDGLHFLGGVINFIAQNWPNLLKSTFYNIFSKI